MLCLRSFALLLWRIAATIGSFTDLWRLGLIRGQDMVVDLSLQVEQQGRGHGLLGDCEPSPAHGEGEHRVPRG